MTTRIFALVLFVAGCTAEIDPEAAPSQAALTMTPGNAALVLDLVNYPGADQAMLDERVNLDARAAANIHAHRAGADGIFPSSDDDLFDDLAELDSIPYVGDTAFVNMMQYAAANPAPTAESVENVLFRGWESEIVTWGVNNVDYGVLDGMLDARAARSLFDGRPYTNVTAMGPRAYVGTTALDRLRREASAWWFARSGGASMAGNYDNITFDHATAVIALEIANDATYEEMVAHGVYAAGAAAIAGNRTYDTLAEVSAVSGVGGSTMRGLHDYATSGAWNPEPFEPPPSEPPPSEPPPSEPPPSTEPPVPADNNCVFGLTYRDIGKNGATIIVAKRVLDPGSDTNATQRAQLVIAVQSAYSSVTTVSQAFAAVDGNEINHVEVWDNSNRRGYTAYEFGAGDNSYGLVFEYGTTNIAARVIDGDLYACTPVWGPEMQTCSSADDCATGLRCQGYTEDDATGRCVWTSNDHQPGKGNPCDLESGCGAGTGLVCAGAYTEGSGYCVPAWMRGYFGSTYGDVAVPDANVNGVELGIQVYGLASVPTDILVDLVISHPRIADLRVTLSNPSGTEIVVFDGTGQTGTEVSLSELAVGVPGDEYVNGGWTLRVVDRASGQTGTIHHAALTITSRWD